MNKVNIAGIEKAEERLKSSLVNTNDSYEICINCKSQTNILRSTNIDHRYGYVVRYAIDATKIANELNWTPEETFATGIKKTIEWYLENTVWCDRVKDGSYQGERLGLVSK